MNQKKIGLGRWSDAEIERFNDAYSQYGRKWVKVAREIGTRTNVQVKNFFSKKQNPNKTCTYWTDRESRKLNEAVKMYGKDYKKIAEYIGTRNELQVSSRIYSLK